MKNVVSLCACVLLAGAAAGCIGFERTSTLGPTASGLAGLQGSWTSANVIPSPQSCTDFKWDVTEQTPTSARGSFSATCAGDLRVVGTASGTLTGSTVTWNAQGTATVPNLPSCSITLSGTAEIAVDSIRVPYAGDTCAGRMSGTEVLRRR